MNDTLEANVVVFWADDGIPECVMISIDALFVGSYVRQAIEEALADVVRPENIFMAASHTHFAPAVEVSKPQLGTFHIHYVDYVCERMIEAARGAMKKRPIQCTLVYCEGTTYQSINRRRKQRISLGSSGIRLNKVQIAPNPSGPTDDTVRILKAVGDEGETICLIWNYACHPVAFPHRNWVSAEFPGFVRERIRAFLGKDAPVLFFQGFAGDLRPRITAKPTTFRDMILGVLNGPRFNTPSDSVWRRWAETLSADVVHIAGTNDARRVEGRIVSTRYALPLERIMSETTNRDLIFHRISIGDYLNIIGISAEPVVEYKAIVDNIFPGSTNIPVGYIDDVYGYCPTERMLSEGGYEVEGFLVPFGHAGKLKHGLESEVRAALRLL